MQNIKVEKNQIILEVILPFMGEYPTYVDNGSKIIHDYEQVLINALTVRAETCTSTLAKNLTRVIFTSENTIIFTKENGSQHQFNIYSYNSMMRGIELLKSKQYKEFMKRPEIISQCQKALYWVNQEDCGQFSFANLITCLEALNNGTYE